MTTATQILELWRTLSPVEQRDVFVAIAADAAFPTIARVHAAALLEQWDADGKPAPGNVAPYEQRQRLSRQLYEAHYSGLMTGDSKIDVATTIRALEWLNFHEDKASASYIAGVMRDAERLVAEYKAKTNNRT
jgi:hypothetical protein